MAVMKFCPTCNRGYSDDSLSFCLDDGSPLTTAGATSGSASDPHATLVYNPGRPTDPTQPQGATAASGSPSANAGWASQGTTVVQPKRRSNALWWVLGIGGVVVIGGVALLLIVGVIGFATLSSNNTGNRNTAVNQNRKADPINDVNNDGRTLALTDDFSEEKWLVADKGFGSSAYVAGGYQLVGLPDRYFVSVAPTNDYLTDENTTVKVTVRSVSGISTNYGYGIAVHASVEDGQANDYAFLIYTGDDPKYVVKLHQNGEATTVKEFTRSSLIRTGTTPNQLEVKITKDQMTFYINGQFATSVPNAAGYSGGRVGLSVHDSYPVAFDDLQIYRQG
jgi:hypothetical protein